jgi:predicted glutamine amidotransferase
MCRWIAYRGRSIPLERYVTEPEHSLVRQSIGAKEALGATQGDGFGLGWYDKHPEPGLYREVRPAWSGREPQAFVPAYLGASLLRACAGRDLDADHEAQLPSFHPWTLHVHA